MQAAEIIRQAQASGVTDPDVIFSRVRDELRLSHEETKDALAQADFEHDGQLDPRVTTLSGGQRSLGFVSF